VDHARQVLHQHRFANAMQSRSRNIRNLIDNGAKKLPAHVGWWLELFIGARARSAEEITAIGRFQIKAHGIVCGMWLSVRTLSK
jgi:hypothetical protein